MNNLKSTITLIYISAVLTACSAHHDLNPLNQLFSSNPELETKAMAVIKNKCASCHGDNANFGGVTKITQVSALISSGLVVPGDSTQGRLMGSMRDKSMPTSGSVTEQEISDVANWIDRGLTNKGIKSNPATPDIPPNFTGSPLQIQALNIINKNCAGCHGSNGSGGISNITNVKHLLDSGLVVNNDPSQGRLLGSIRDGSMPPVGPLGSLELSVLEDWVSQGVDSSGGIILPQEKLEPTFASISKLILLPKCTACHGSTRADDGIRLDSYDRVFAKSEMIKLGDPKESKLYKSVHEGEMPPQRDGYQPLSQEEVDTIYEWIENGALNN